MRKVHNHSGPWLVKYTPYTFDDNSKPLVDSHGFTLRKKNGIIVGLMVHLQLGGRKEQWERWPRSDDLGKTSEGV
jgi:hypothetical protein